MRAPSVGQAIGLQGVDESTRRLGNLVFKMGQAEQDRNLKRGVIQAQKNQKKSKNF
jgi:hypothetical protein